MAGVRGDRLRRRRPDNGGCSPHARLICPCPAYHSDSHACDSSETANTNDFNYFEIAQLLIQKGMCWNVEADTSNIFYRCLALDARKETETCIEPQCDPERDGYTLSREKQAKDANNPALMQVRGVRAENKKAPVLTWGRG